MSVWAGRLHACLVAAGLLFGCSAAVLAQSAEDAPDTPALETIGPVAPAPTTSVINAPPTPVIVNVPSPVEPPRPLEGIWLTTEFPALSQGLGEAIRFDLKLDSRNLPPRRVDLTVDGLPDGWLWEFEGGGRPVTAALVGIDQSVALMLKVVPPADAAPGRRDFTVIGRASPDTLELPISLDLGAEKAARVVLTPKLPTLHGTSQAPFDFVVTATNEGADDQVLGLVAEAPAGGVTTFTGQAGGEELASIPVRAGESKDFRVRVRLAPETAAGRYAVTVRAVGSTSAADAVLTLDVAGQPSLAILGPEGRLSGDATAGRERAFNFTLRNSGTAPARDVKLDGSAPAGWQLAIEPVAIAVLEPGQELPVKVGIGPTEKAIAGDYAVSVRAAGEGTSAAADFRVTVLTSTLWGIAGLGVIGAAVIVLAVAVTRYGRR